MKYNLNEIKITGKITSEVYHEHNCIQFYITHEDQLSRSGRLSPESTSIFVQINCSDSSLHRLLEQDDRIIVVGSLLFDSSKDGHHIIASFVEKFEPADITLYSKKIKNLTLVTNYNHLH